MEKAFQIERAQTAAQRIVSGEGSRDRKSGRGGRGGKGGRGGRGGGRGGHKGGARNGRNGETKNNSQGGEKRKRGVEPDDDGPSNKGPSVPIIHITKKAKTDES